MSVFVDSFTASLDDAAAALAEAVEALEQAAESAPKGPDSGLARRLGGLGVAAGLVRSDVKRMLGQALKP